MIWYTIINCVYLCKVAQGLLLCHIKSKNWLWTNCWMIKKSVMYSVLACQEGFVSRAIKWFTAINAWIYRRKILSLHLPEYCFATVNRNLIYQMKDCSLLQIIHMVQHFWKGKRGIIIHREKSCPSKKKLLLVK